jgi:long-subunit fatty acid transport protein
MKRLRAKIAITVFCLCLVVVSDAFADDYHYVNMLVGDRATGLGGAYTAVSDDPAGCFFNPAGIAFAPHSSLSASVNAFATSTKTYQDALLDVNGNTLDWEQESSSLVPNFFGIVRKFGSGMVAFSYAVPDSIQRRQKQTFHDIRSVIPNNDIGLYTININDSDKTYLLGPSYAYGFSDSFSVGATLYLYYRDMEVIRNQMLQFEQGEHYLINYYETKTDWGYKPILGAIWEPMDKLAIGLSVSKIYVTSSDNEQQTTFRDTTRDEPYVDDYNYDFSDTDTIYFRSSSHKEKDKFPLTASLGLAYFASPRLLLSGDITYYEEVSDKEAVYNFALGAEYYLTDTFAVRAGFFTDNANTPDLSSGDYNQPEHIDIYGTVLSASLFGRTSSITLGMSYGLGKGDAQIVQNNPTIQDAKIENFTAYVSASYHY